ncbi:transposase, partial [Neisseria sp. 19428wB4_WF04]
YAGLKRHIRAACRQHKGRCGCRRITAAIRYAGMLANHKTISRLKAVSGRGGGTAVPMPSIARSKEAGNVAPLSCNAVSRRKSQMGNG